MHTISAALARRGITFRATRADGRSDNTFCLKSGIGDLGIRVFNYARRKTRRVDPPVRRVNLRAGFPVLIAENVRESTAVCSVFHLPDK